MAHYVRAIGAFLCLSFVYFGFSIPATADPCGQRARLKSFDNQAAQRCDIQKILDDMRHNNQVAGYCYLRQNTKTEKQNDKVVFGLVEAKMEVANGAINAAQGVLKGPAGAANKAKALDNMVDAAQAAGSAAVAAGDYFKSTGEQSEWARLYHNAEHQISLFERLLAQMQARPDCPPTGN